MKMTSPQSSDHGMLTGLADDDHGQYLLLAGRAGGQKILDKIALFNASSGLMSVAPLGSIILNYGVGVYSVNDAGNNISNLFSMRQEGALSNVLVIGSLVEGAQDWPQAITFRCSGAYPENMTERMRIAPGGNVGIGTTNPSARLHAVSTTEQLRIGYDASNYFNIVVGATGSVNFGGAGSNTGFQFPNTKFGLFGAAPVTQPAGANQAALTNSTGGTYDGTLVDVTTAGIADPAKINNNFTDLYTLLTEIRSALVTLGAIKGAA